MKRSGRISKAATLSAKMLRIGSFMEELYSMSVCRSKFGLITAVLITVLTVGACSTAVLAASKAKAKVSPASYGLTKIYIPPSIIKGSLVTKGRTFYRSSQPETTLAGIRLGRSANTILALWGNPTRITTGVVQAEVADVSQPSQPPSGPSYIPPSSSSSIGSVYGPYFESLNRAASWAGMQGPALPSLPGLEAPGMTTPPSTTPQQTPGGTQTRTLRQEEVTWTYDLPNGITLEFIITNGIVTQITVGGEGPWALSKTRTGIQLGDSYKLVLTVCGFPEEPQRYVGRFLRVSYVEKNRVLFTFLNKRVVGITIALVPDELTLKK